MNFQRKKQLDFSENEISQKIRKNFENNRLSFAIIQASERANIIIIIIIIVVH